MKNQLLQEYESKRLILQGLLLLNAADNDADTQLLQRLINHFAQNMKG